MNIRAHHLLCMRFFRGRGYSKEFVDNFYEVLLHLGRNPIIKIVNHPDIICDKCPHSNHGKCIKKGPYFEDEVKAKDDFIIAQLGLSAGQKMPFKQVSQLVEQKIKSVRKICIECEWLSYCQQSKKQSP